MNRRQLARVSHLLSLFAIFSTWSCAASVKDGLILHLDAAEQVRAGGLSVSNSVWRNLANAPATVAGDGTLRGFAPGNYTGWTGSGTTDDPYALRFDGKQTYVVGPGNLELPELTLETWAIVEGSTLRGATLIGNDFGEGGVSLLIQPVSESPVLLHGITFTPVEAETGARQWHQFVLVMKNELATIYVDGVREAALNAPRKLQQNHYPGWQLGAARHPKSDFAEADGLSGSIAIVRAYARALSPEQISTNFKAEKSRFPLASISRLLEAPARVPVSTIPGLPTNAAPTEAKWDYYYHPVRVSGTGPTGWPYGMRWAFDGYPSNARQPYVRNFWRTNVIPSPQNPAFAVIDYRQPLAVTRFMHFFTMYPGLSGWKDVDIYTSSDRETWTLRQQFRGLAADYPQRLELDQPVSARFYKIVVSSLTDGATALQTQELETWYGTKAATSETTKTLKKATSESRPAQLAKATKPGKTLSVTGKSLEASLRLAGDGVAISHRTPALDAPLEYKLKLFHDGRQTPLALAECRGEPTIVAQLGKATFWLQPAATSGGKDLSLRCRLLNVSETRPFSYVNLELRIATANPRVMFRPHIDWYRAEKGPNVPQVANGHNSATRMLCIQTDQGCLSLVPSTDNLTWGFTKENEMTASFKIPCSNTDPFKDIFRPITVSPTEFELVLPATAGDSWEAYRYVVEKLFNFEQPRQWAIPVTQMQMLAARSVLRSEVWSEKWQTVRSHPWFDFFYQFYGTTYTLPALYSWYLVTDDPGAKEKTGKVLNWLLSVQEQNGPVDGAWFSQYCVENNPPQLVGRDQAWNRWVMPHSTGTAVKTLLWYWQASGKRHAKAFAAARRGADWLLSTQRLDGGWPYAFDLQGKPVTELADAGQIWCTWSLWKMFEATKEERYKSAAMSSGTFFKKTFMDVHRYMGYWEDVSGAEGKVQRSWEGYEPAIAELVFADMGDKESALAAAKDAAVWSWTRVTSTRQYETGYGETTEQSLCGPSQAQSPMTGIGAERVYELTGDRFWSDISGAMKSINFCADPDQAYGMVATGGWDDPLTGVVGPPYENVRPWVTPNNSKGDEYGRQVWNEWLSSQFAWLALEWLVREANIRAGQFVTINPDTYRGTVLGLPGRVKMPEERCDISLLDHIDLNWVGFQNDENYVLLVMNHKEKCRVLLRPHEAHLDILTKPPRVLVGGKSYKETKVVKRGVQYLAEIPAGGNALFIWDRIK